MEPRIADAARQRACQGSHCGVARARGATHDFLLQTCTRMPRRSEDVERHAEMERKRSAGTLALLLSEARIEHPHRFATCNRNDSL